MTKYITQRNEKNMNARKRHSRHNEDKQKKAREIFRKRAGDRKACYGNGCCEYSIGSTTGCDE